MYGFSDRERRHDCDCEKLRESCEKTCETDRGRRATGGRRFATIDLLRQETTAWHPRSNDKQRGVDWQFRIDDARIKLQSVYPKIKA